LYVLCYWLIGCMQFEYFMVFWIQFKFSWSNLTTHTIKIICHLMVKNKYIIKLYTQYVRVNQGRNHGNIRIVRFLIRMMNMLNTLWPSRSPDLRPFLSASLLTSLHRPHLSGQPRSIACIKTIRWLMWKCRGSIQVNLTNYRSYWNDC